MASCPVCSRPPGFQLTSLSAQNAAITARHNRPWGIARLAHPKKNQAENNAACAVTLSSSSSSCSAFPRAQGLRSVAHEQHTRDHLLLHSRGPASGGAQHSSEAISVSLRAAASPSAVSAEEDAEECELVLGREVIVGGEEISEAFPDAFGAYLVQPLKNSNGSGVLLLSDVLGYESPETREFAYRLACFGYSVFVPDLFRGHPWDPSRPQSEYEAWRAEHARPARIAMDIAEATTVLFTALRDHEHGGAGPPGNGRLAVLGFCLGGGRVLEVLAADAEQHGSGQQRFTTGVFFYGTRFDPALADRVGVPVLFITGDRDELCPVGDVEALARKIGRGSAARVYTERGHAFAHRPSDMEEDEDAEDAFQATRHWLHEHLLAGAPGHWAVDAAVAATSAAGSGSGEH